MLHDGCIRSRHICTRRFNVYNIHIHGRSVITTYVSFLVLPCLLRDICVTLPGKAQQLQEQRYPFLSVCAVFSCIRQWYDCQCSVFLTSAQMLMHATSHEGCTDTVRQSALEVDSGRKIPCLTWDTNVRQYCAWLFSRML